MTRKARTHSLVVAGAILLTTSLMQAQEPPHAPEAPEAPRAVEVPPVEPAPPAPPAAVVGVSRAYLGISVVDLNESLCQHFGVDAPSALLLDSVTKGSPADEGGLAVGDILVAINGVPTPDSGRLISYLFRREAGEIATLSIVRGGKEQKLEVTLGEREDAPWAIAPRTPRSARAIERKAAREAARARRVEIDEKRRQEITARAERYREQHAKRREEIERHREQLRERQQERLERLEKARKKETERLSKLVKEATARVEVQEKVRAEARERRHRLQERVRQLELKVRQLERLIERQERALDRKRANGAKD